ncbi:MAG: peroxiredoxin [Methylococcaceae bacterium]|nr:peroxiredoxin [Methylococcaceae bacterium]
MTAISLDQPVPDFEAAATGEQSFKLSDYRGHYVLLYFYPKDSTPGCTQEGQDFRDHIEQFKALNCVIFGVSRDSLRSHENFKCKQNFPFELLADTDESVCQLFEVIKMKNMYGKQVRGIERSTFLINPEGILIKAWRPVKVKGHIEELLSTLTTLNS